MTSDMEKALAAIVPGQRLPNVGPPPSLVKSNYQLGKELMAHPHRQDIMNLLRVGLPLPVALALDDADLAVLSGRTETS